MIEPSDFRVGVSDTCELADALHDSIRLPHRIGIPALRQEERTGRRAAIEIDPEIRGEFVRERNDSAFVASSRSHDERASVQVEVSDVEGNELCRILDVDGVRIAIAVVECHRCSSQLVMMRPSPLCGSARILGGDRSSISRCRDRIGGTSRIRAGTVDARLRGATDQARRWQQ